MKGYFVGSYLIRKYFKICIYLFILINIITNVKRRIQISKINKSLIILFLKKHLRWYHISTYDNQYHDPP